jgi:tRNA pseudouridine38-40 synthase
VNVRLLIAYHGGAFHGWQRQADGVRTVQGEVERALSQMHHGPMAIRGASRTDAGVHALGQVAAFAADGRHDVGAYLRGLNHLTPADIAIRAVDEVADTFHPRHSARGKIYRYRIVDGFAGDPMLRDRAWHVRRRLDASAMHEAAQLLVGVHDFSSFRAAGCDASSPVRELYAVRVRRLRGEVEVEVIGSAFLKYMVRAIVGTLVEVGRGRRPGDWLRDVLAARDRSAAGPTAAACGLTLIQIFYPDWPRLTPELDGGSESSSG